jgi:hypothetical protein
MASSQKADDQYYFKYGSIPKLTFTNYHIWQPDMENFLRVIDALEIVHGNETLPAEDEAAIALFKSRSAKAIAMIYSSCTQGVKSRIRGIEDPAAMWKRLKEMFCMTDTLAGRIAISRRFHSLAPTSDDLIEYVSEVLVCSGSAGSSQVITDGEVIAKLTSTVPGFSIYLHHIMLCNPKNVETLDFVIKSLLGFDQDSKRERLRESLDADGGLDSTKPPAVPTSRKNSRGPSPCNSSLYSGVRKSNYRGNRNRGL